MVFVAEIKYLVIIINVYPQYLRQRAIKLQDALKTALVRNSYNSLFTFMALYTFLVS